MVFWKGWTGLCLEETHSSQLFPWLFLFSSASYKVHAGRLGTYEEAQSPLGFKQRRKEEMDGGGRQAERQGRRKGLGKKGKAGRRKERKLEGENGGRKAVGRAGERVGRRLISGVKVVVHITAWSILMCGLRDSRGEFYLYKSKIPVCISQGILFQLYSLWSFKSSRVLAPSVTNISPMRFLIGMEEVKGHVTPVDKTRRYTDSLETSRFWKVPDVEKNWKGHRNGKFLRGLPVSLSC